jgi:TPR repeat protein
MRFARLQRPDRPPFCHSSLTMSCDGGNMRGCFNLALEYENGVGVPRGQSKAAKRVTRLATADFNTLVTLYRALAWPAR